jgi:hypothetical protein
VSPKRIFVASPPRLGPFLCVRPRLSGIAGFLVAGVCLGTLEILLIFFTHRLLRESLPLLSHFAQERFEARINCSARLLEASRSKSSICS